MKISCFEDIEAWKEARGLVKEIYGLFADNKDFSFRDQIQRAAISIMSNIAEGFDRGSNKEFIQFLTMARGSVSEVRSLINAALDLGYVNDNAFTSINERCQNLAIL